VDLIVEIAFSENIDLDAAVARNGAVIAAFATRRDRPDFPFWPMLFDNITIRLLGVDDFPQSESSAWRAGLTPRGSLDPSSMGSRLGGWT
jgi:NADPH2:quinone reductase